MPAGWLLHYKEHQQCSNNPKTWSDLRGLREEGEDEGEVGRVRWDSLKEIGKQTSIHPQCPSPTVIDMGKVVHQCRHLRTNDVAKSTTVEIAIQNIKVFVTQGSCTHLPSGMAM